MPSCCLCKSRTTLKSAPPLIVVCSTSQIACLPWSDACSMTHQRRVFVQIPSYRDAQLIPTLIDLADNAVLPAAIRVVVCWQHGTEESIEAFESFGMRLDCTASVDGRAVHSLAYRGVTIELIDVPFQEAEGAGWARSMAQKRYKGEEYNLQIDAHHRFAQGWDIQMVTMLESLMSVSSKPLLTGHPPAFLPEDYPEGRQEHASVMMVDEFTPLGVVRFRAKRVPSTVARARPWRARFMSGGFVFSRGSFIGDVPQDPNHFFATEEVVMTVRAYTRGYDMFHPHVALLWHYYGNNSPKVWVDHATDPAGVRRTGDVVDERMLASAWRARSLLGLVSEARDREDDVFGLGGVRTLQEYERYAGVSFSLRGVHASAMPGVEPGDSLLDIEAAEWETDLICRRRIRVVVSFNPTERVELYSAQVCMKTVCGEVVVVRDLSSEEVFVLSTGSRLEFPYEHSSGPRGLPSAFAVEATTDHPDAQRFFAVAACEFLD